MENIKKYYIVNSKGSIEWVPSLEIAKTYIENPTNTEWYRKEILTTTEEIKKSKEGICYLKSKFPKDEIEFTIEDKINFFKEQASYYIDNVLENLYKKYNFSSLENMISWYNSSVKEYKLLAKLAIEYRDSIYKYTEKFINNLDVIEKDADMTELYTDFIKNFPKLSIN